MIVPMIDGAVDHDHRQEDGRMGLEAKIEVMLRKTMVLDAEEGMDVC